MQTLIIPWFDSGCKARFDNFEYVKQYYKDYRLIIGTGNTRGLARNDGALKARALGIETLFFMDADMLIPHIQVDTAITAATATGGIVYAYDRLIRLSELQSRSARKGMDQSTQGGSPEAGALAIRTDSFIRAHGYPHMAVTEDSFLHVVSESLFGPPARVLGYAHHLWHPETDHIAPIHFRQLLARFEYAASDPRRIEALLKETPEYEGTGHW